MSTVGPVCHIPPVNNIQQPTAHDLTSVSPAQPNIQSLTATVNQLRQIVINLLNRPNNGQWVEESRVTERVKVTNPNDATQFVMVDRINQLIMVDRVSGQRWTWNRTRAS
jgi:hypothetical protein